MRSERISGRLTDGLGEEVCRCFVRKFDNKGNEYPDGYFHTDISGMNILQLIEAGVPEGSINDCRLCIYTESDMFNSRRASQSKNCSLSGIML